MDLQAVGEPLRNAEKVEKSLRKKPEKLVAENPDAVNRICPIYKQSAPDHHRKQGEIYPVEPSNGEWMFFFELFLHTNVFVKIMLLVSRRVNVVPNEGFAGRYAAVNPDCIGHRNQQYRGNDA
jgi:hypothetical protein